MSNVDNKDTGQQFAGMNVGCVVSSLEDGKCPSSEYLDEAYDGGKMLFASLDCAQVGQILAQMMLGQGAITKEAFENTVGSQIHIKGDVLTLILHGKERYPDGSFTPAVED